MSTIRRTYDYKVSYIGGGVLIPYGYYNDSITVTAPTLASQTYATATAADIRKGKTAWINGVLVTGTSEGSNVVPTGTQLKFLDNEQIGCIYLTDFNGILLQIDAVNPITLAFELIFYFETSSWSSQIKYATFGANGSSHTIYMDLIENASPATIYKLNLIATRENTYKIRIKATAIDMPLYFDATGEFMIKVYRVIDTL